MTIQRLKFTTGVTAALIAAVASTGAWAASHREAPGVSAMPKVDSTDFYAFKSYEPGRGDFVTFIANYQPLEIPFGGPNYYTMDENAVYEIHVDNNGDANEDLTFQFKFDNKLKDDTGIALKIGTKTVAIPLRQAGSITSADTSKLNERETYSVRVIAGDRRSGFGKSELMTRAGTSTSTFVKPVDNIGNKTIKDYNAYANAYIYDVKIPNCTTNGKVFVGQRKEAFSVNLGEIFDLVNFNPITIADSPANNDVANKFNVTSIALEVPIKCLTAGTDPVIGAWTTASLPQAQLRDPSPTYEQTSKYGGAYVQVSRLGAPLVNEVVIGLKDKDLFSAAEPRIDGALADYVTNPTLPALLEQLFGVKAPTNLPRTDLVAAFLTGFKGFNQPANFDPKKASEMLRLNTAVAATPEAQQHQYGVVAEDLAGFPNGRRPIDDVVDIALRVAMGALCYDVPLGAELSGDASKENTPADLINLGYCKPADAPDGDKPYKDGAPTKGLVMLKPGFPYLDTPIAGSPN